MVFTHFSAFYLFDLLLFFLILMLFQRNFILQTILGKDIILEQNHLKFQSKAFINKNNYL